MSDPLSYGIPLRKSLKGFYKIRVGDYRIIYCLRKQEVLVLKIQHRKKVYNEMDKRV